MTDYIFGKYVDDEKKSTMSFRVSKKTKEIFKTHANKKFGGTSNALKEIFLDYMSRHAFRRQTVKSYMLIFIPRLKGGDSIPQNMLPIDYQHIYAFYEVYPDDLLDVNNVVVSPFDIVDVNYMDLSDPFEKDKYDELHHWLEKDSEYKMDDGFFVRIPINNQLDKNVDGIYYVNKEEYSQHCGLNIVEYEGYTYYIHYFFKVLEDETLSIDYVQLIPNEAAFKYALGRDNIELCRLIDSFKVGLSNIKENKRMMLDKKENLLKQIREIDCSLSKFD